MIYILLRALCNAGFAQLLRLGQVRRPRTVGVITVNYLVATVVSLALAGIRGRVHFLPATVGFGALGGVGYIASILLMMPAMRRSGVSVAVAVLQLAVLVPVAFAMVAFAEWPSGPQWIGIALAALSLALLSVARTLPAERPVEKSPRGPRQVTSGAAEKRDEVQPASGFASSRDDGPTAHGLPKPAGTSQPASRRMGPRFSPLLIVLFFITGISGIAMKAFHEYAPAPELPGFMAVLFATATAGGALVAAARREPLERADWAIGAAVGLANAAQLEFLLRAMETLPAIVVFPVSSALSLVLNTLASILWWGERLDPATTLGLALALGATVLLNR